ncbi:MAG: ubiquinol-cytochrome C chaperone family protein [Alphaproteobacteria bacterium]
MFLSRLFTRPSETEPADALYGVAVARAREPAFYRDFGVPDTVEGRFEMISLHVYLILHRLKRASGARAHDSILGQALFDVMFADMDRSLREMGVGDLGVGRRVKIMAEAFYGRIRAYDDGLAAGKPALARALARNVLNSSESEPEGVALARYVVNSIHALADVPDGELARGRAVFAPLPGGATDDA